MEKVLSGINGVVWGIPTLLLILLTGLLLSVQSRFAQFRLFPKAIRQFVSNFTSKEKKHDGVSGMQALCTALAATVGTGNLAGVAGAIAIGGPGAVFWMWVSALLGMVIKYAEALLSVRFRVRNEQGEFVGGPMYVIRNGMGKRWNWLASLYCFFGVVAAFGVGNATQINTLVSSINDLLRNYGGQPSMRGNLLMGIGFSVLIFTMLSGGAKRIGVVAERMVPFASVLYLLMGMIVLTLRAAYIPSALKSIVIGAFSPSALTGGVVGTFLQSARIGTSRGIFTNEAGMGTAGIAHGAANVVHPVEQGLMGIVEVFLDTIVICTMTALVILCSGVPIDYGYDSGIVLTNQAFSSVVGDWIRIPITLSLCFFAFATVLGWGLYGVRCAQFLFGYKSWMPFLYLQAATVVISAAVETGPIWLVAETVNGLMAIPNLVVLIYLSAEVRNLTNRYKQTC